MFGFFLSERLDSAAATSRETYKYAKPFCHAVFDDLCDGLKLCDVVEKFPGPSDLQWWSYDNVFEKKLAFDKVHLLPDPLKQILCEMNSGQFVSFLESLTGIDGLIPDYGFSGGGLHQIARGGLLDIHADFNVHTKMSLRRRLNVIMYLNLDWRPEFGGDLELWDKDMKECHHKIAPQFNRMVVFDTSQPGYHGHPHPLTCPPHRTRKSLALYYYTADLSEEQKRNRHSTLYQKKPGDPNDPKIEELRKKRATGRLEDKISRPD